jgi:multiple sugar transport system substrate-binding protein
MSKLRKIGVLLAATSLLAGFQTTVASAATEVTVVIRNSWKPAFEPAIKKFNAANKDVQINVLWGAAQDQLIAAKKAPDIINTGDLYINDQKNLLLDLRPFITRDKTLNKSDFFPELLKALQLNGRQLALPNTFNVGLLYYNKDLFDDAKVAYPTSSWTQADFLDAAKKLTKSSGGKITQWGVANTFGWWGEWLIHVRQSGGEWLRGGRVTLNSPGSIKGLQLFYDKAATLKVSPGPKDDSLGGFAGGKTAMEYGGHTGNWTGYNNAKGLNWDIAVLPRGFATSKGGELALEGWGVNAATKDPKAAYKVASFLVSPEVLKAQWDFAQVSVSRKSVAEGILATPKAKRTSPQNLEALFDGIASGVTLPRNIPFIKVTQEVVQPYIDKMLEGTLSPRQAADQATAAANKALNR